MTAVGRRCDVIRATVVDDPPATYDWKQYQGAVAIPPGTKQILIAPQIYGPGTVWFDELKAEYTTEPVIDPVSPQTTQSR